MKRQLHSSIAWFLMALFCIFFWSGIISIAAQALRIDGVYGPTPAPPPPSDDDVRLEDGPPTDHPVIPCDESAVLGYVVNCKAPCGCVFEGGEEELVECPHGKWYLDP